MERERLYIGIDPGKTGALAIYSPRQSKDSRHLLQFIDWPKEDDESIICEKITQLFLEKDYPSTCFWVEVQLCVLEKVSAMPKQGVKSMFSFGKNYGMWLMLTAWMRWPRRFLTPQQWRKGLVTPGDGNDPKTANYKVAKRLFPHAEFTGKRGGLLDGRVDAALMAYRAFLLSRGSFDTPPSILRGV
jgi:crossover junction endodeoxyribonuclease RuvC